MLFENVIGTLEGLGRALLVHFPIGLEQIRQHFGPRSAAALCDGVEQRVARVEADAEAFVHGLDAVIQQRRIGRLQNDTKQELGQYAEAAAIGAAAIGALLRELVPYAEVSTMIELNTTELLERAEFDNVSDIEFALGPARKSLEQLRIAHRSLIQSE